MSAGNGRDDSLLGCRLSFDIRKIQLRALRGVSRKDLGRPRALRHMLRTLARFCFFSAQHGDQLPEVPHRKNGRSGISGCQTGFPQVCLSQIDLPHIAVEPAHHRQDAAHALYFSAQVQFSEKGSADQCLLPDEPLRRQDRDRDRQIIMTSALSYPRR